MDGYVCNVDTSEIERRLDVARQCPKPDVDAVLAEMLMQRIVEIVSDSHVQRAEPAGG